MTTWITICDTCKRDDWAARGIETTDGETFAALIEAAAAAQGAGDVRTRRHSCLMGCASGCNVTIQAAGKLAYTLGAFTPSAEAAAAVLDYATLHAASDTGQVPYRTWPQGVKGHFVTRHPPLPETPPKDRDPA
jgi:predicted metal-binding protein